MGTRSRASRGRFRVAAANQVSGRDWLVASSRINFANSYQFVLPPAPRPLTAKLEAMAGRVWQVVTQARARIFQGILNSPGENRQSLRTAHGDYPQGESEQADGIWQTGPDARGRESNHHLVSGVRRTSQRSGPIGASRRRRSAAVRKLPRLVAADAGFYSQANEKKVQEMGVSWVAVANRSTQAPLRNGGPGAKTASAC